MRGKEEILGYLVNIATANIAAAMSRATGRLGKRSAPEGEQEAPRDVTNVVVKIEDDGPQGSSAKRQCISKAGKKALQNSMVEFRPLLEQLRYGKVIKKISEIRNMTKEDISKKFGSEMILPRILVIGNESSGKSSTLERIAGQPVLPVRLACVCSLHRRVAVDA